MNLSVNAMNTDERPFALAGDILRNVFIQSILSTVCMILNGEIMNIAGNTFSIA